MNPTHASIRAVLADDNDNMHLLLRKALESHCADVDLNCFRNGESLLDHLAHTQEIPDFILLDLRMPGRDGAEILTEIQAMETIAAVPVFVFSYSDREEDHSEVRERGASGFYVKPASFRDLQAMTGDILKKIEPKAST